MTFAPAPKRPPAVSGPSSSRSGEAASSPPSSPRYPEPALGAAASRRPLEPVSGPPSSTRGPLSSRTTPASRLPAGDVLPELLSLMTRYVSLPTAQSVVALTRRRTGIHGPGLQRDQLREMLDPIDRHLRLFIGNPQQAADCLRGLAALAGAQPVTLPEALLLDVRVEDDVAKVRREARDFVAARGFTAAGQTRFTTAVSELARNIVQYAGAGQIEIKASASPPGVDVTARDRGPGIANLEQILAGNYRSRLGMGLGLQGVKKLADRFDVHTGPQRGTTVSFTMKVV